MIWWNFNVIKYLNQLFSLKIHDKGSHDWNHKFSIENTLTCDVKSVVRLIKIFLKRKMFFDKQMKKKLNE